MCNWVSVEYGRSRVVPHIKTYTRLSPDRKKVAWFLLTSANLSKAAWGARTASGALRVRSYELGVLFVGDGKGLDVGGHDGGMIVPYSTPPKPYEPTDAPWLVNLKYSKMDTRGNKWPVDMSNPFEWMDPGP